ncbi:Lin0368 family putative glycerol transporter subunit [Peribacillus sp. SCS-155]|uniref:Lin0368 family putative glycerol transporter subunit n=1 Tax=Peribacillus sedimenti TaxID=3115297 RepID=UPI0039059138
MGFLRGSIGFCIAGMLVMSVWGAFATSYGIAGGYVAAIIIIGPMWYLNHYVGLIPNEDDAAFVDMALGIAICGTMRDVFMNGGGALQSSLPTLSLVAIGAVAAGIVGAMIQKDMAKKAQPIDILEKKQSA